MDSQHEEIVFRGQRSYGPTSEDCALSPRPQCRIVDVQRHSHGRESRVDFEADPTAFIKYGLTALESSNEVKLCRAQLRLALVAQPAQGRDCRCNVGITNEQVQ